MSEGSIRASSNHNMSLVEKEYQLRMQALSIAERVERSAAMLKWTREMLARQIVSEQGSMSDERLRWQVALRMYGDEPAVRKMIEQRLKDVPN